MGGYSEAMRKELVEVTAGEVVKKETVKYINMKSIV
jgi:hypothetical protein